MCVCVEKNGRPTNFDLLVNLIITSFGLCCGLLIYCVCSHSWPAEKNNNKSKSNSKNSTRWQIYSKFVYSYGTKRIFHNTYVICRNTHEIRSCVWSLFAWFLHFFLFTSHLLVSLLFCTAHTEREREREIYKSNLFNAITNRYVLTLLSVLTTNNFYVYKSPHYPCTHSQSENERDTLSHVRAFAHSLSDKRR